MSEARVCRTAPVWEFDKEILGVPVSDVIISTEGMAAGAYENRLLIHDLSSVSFKSTDPFFISLLDRKSVDRKLELAQGLTIKNLAFSAMVDGFVHGPFQSIKDVTDPTFGRSVSNQSTSMGQVAIAEYD